MIEQFSLYMERRENIEEGRALWLQNHLILKKRRSENIPELRRSIIFFGTSRSFVGTSTLSESDSMDITGVG